MKIHVKFEFWMKFAEFLLEISENEKNKRSEIIF